MMRRASGMMEGPLLPMVNVVVNSGPRAVTLSITPLGRSEAWLTWSGNAILEAERESRILRERREKNNADRGLVERVTQQKVRAYAARILARANGLLHISMDWTSCPLYVKVCYKSDT